MLKKILIQILIQVPKKIGILHPRELVRIYNVIPVIEKLNSNENKENLWDLIIRFVNIWPVSQWLWSLLSLVLIYILFSHIYNKWFAKKIGYYMSNKLIVNLIVFDVVLNFIIGVYYMGHRDTAFGLFMLKCPIAISPFIFMIEFIIIIILFLIFNRKK